MLTDHGPLGVPGRPVALRLPVRPALTVGGGTGEVQRNIIAERVLGLPHDSEGSGGGGFDAGADVIG